MPSALSSLIRLPERDDYLKTSERFRRAGPSLQLWSKHFRVEEGEPLDFETFPFQRELYDAFGDKELGSVDVMKSAQCGISAAAVSMALYVADCWRASVLYVLPTEDISFQFSDTRVKPAIEDSVWLSHRVASTDNKGLKRLGEAFIYFTGSGSERRALSIPADVLVLDEYDRLDQTNIPKFRRRLNAPTSLRLERRFSNPSFPETGIHELFLASDQRQWFVRCPKCRHEGEITYDAGDGHHVDEERELRVCGRCHIEIGPEAVQAGRWVAAYPKAGRRGYHISRLAVPSEDVSAIVESHGLKPEDDVQAHYNFDLGLPYSPKGGSLSRDQVLACRRDWSLPDGYGGPDWVTAGVDVGSVLHIRISRWLPSGKAVPLWLGEVDGFTDLSQIWDRYNVNFGLIDERPEERKAREFMDARRGRVLLCRWAGDEQRDPIVIDEDRGLLVARRTAACDRLVVAVAEQRKLLPADVPAPYTKQMTAPHRTVETNTRGQKIARYISERADHYFFAELYDLLAREARPAPAMAPGEEPTTIREQIRRKRRTTPSSR
jgi:hypothetical protein